MAKMNDRVTEERLGSNTLNDIFLKIYSYDPTSELQELESGSDQKLRQSKIKICKTDFCELRKCEIKNSSKSVIEIFLKFWL